MDLVHPQRLIFTKRAPTATQRENGINVVRIEEIEDYH